MAKIVRTVKILLPDEAKMTPDEQVQYIASILGKVKKVDRHKDERGYVYYFRNSHGHILRRIHEANMIHPLWREAIKRVEAKINQIQS